ncbi:hypothetical protein SKAU_G00150060 [Synaphobranchus kaupii]|uniref:DUF5641 domain-containing protein n=1 Tax=Synaphobranchus kaupii TaxID=118154 RepID=A0A9Q1FTZ7_SYNKA|nr:hypothetical protein SKAU_G00150060 [Synaphobranchus kaupii]
MCHRVAVRELPPVTPADAIKVLESDFKDASTDKTVSQDDLLFLDKLKEGIKRNTHDHYEMPLPFKERPYLPDNKQLAMVRLGHLKRKLLKGDKSTKHSIVQEREDARRIIIKDLQKQVYPEEMKLLDDASLRTVFYEAMTIVNSRPLTVDNLSDPESPVPLTPNHLLTTKPIIALPPPGKFIREDMYARKRWRHVQYLAEQFWSRWRREYLSNIATRQCWHTPRRNLKVGDIVMEKTNDLPRNEWKLAKVVETVTDKDGLVRRVKIRIGDQKMGNVGQRSGKPSIVERPVQKLILLLESV